MARDATAPLERHLHPLEEVSAVSAPVLAEAASALGRTAERLRARVAERQGADAAR